jgi:arylsulfatase A-like enzyme
MTHPSLSSMLTGLFPLRHGVNGQAGQLLPRVVPLPQLLRARGVETASFVANLCKLQDQERTVFRAGWDTLMCGMDMEVDQYLWDEAVVTAALDWLSAHPAGGGRPWFAWVHLMDPHAEHRPPPDQWDWAARPPKEKLAQYREFGAYEERREMPPEARLEELLELYAAEVRGADAQLGRLLAGLDQRADRERTAVIFSSDHGEELFETWSRYDHGLSLTEGVLWVPLMVQSPGLAPGRSDEPVELLQITPTVLELFGLEPPYPLDGASLLAHAPSRGFAVSSLGNITVTIHDGQHRYWWRRSEEPFVRPPNEAPWRADAPYYLERECLARYPSRTAVEWLDPRAHAELSARMNEQVQGFLTGLGTLRQSTEITDPELLEQLSELGYAAGD